MLIYSGWWRTSQIQLNESCIQILLILGAIHGGFLGSSCEEHPQKWLNVLEVQISCTKCAIVGFVFDPGIYAIGVYLT